MTNNYLSDGEIIMMEMEEEDRKERENLEYYLDRRESLEKELAIINSKSISMLIDSMNNLASSFKENLSRPNVTVNVFISSDADIKTIKSTIDGLNQLQLN